MQDKKFVELEILGTTPASADGKALLILREKGGERILPIITSPRRAMFLVARSRLPLPLPLPVSVADITHQLMNAFGLNLKHIELTAVKEGVFFCRVVGEQNGEEHQVDFCQAPDGLILATTSGCPILIAEELLAAQYMHKVGQDTYAMNINNVSRSMLEEALEQAVAAENYEAASRLRDEIQKRKASENEAPLTTLDSLFSKDE